MDLVIHESLKPLDVGTHMTEAHSQKMQTQLAGLSAGEKGTHWGKGQG